MWCERACVRGGSPVTRSPFKGALRSSLESKHSNVHIQCLLPRCIVCIIKAKAWGPTHENMPPYVAHVQNRIPLRLRVQTCYVSLLEGALNYHPCDKNIIRSN